MSSSGFGELVFAAEQISNNIDNSTDLPQVERSLRQVIEASNELYTRVRQTGAYDIQANLLLGSKGIDLPQIAQKLESISAKRTFEPLDPVKDNDIQSYLKNEIENCILNCIDGVHKHTVDNIEAQMRDHNHSEWEQEKRKILNAMIGPSQNFLDFRKQTVIDVIPDHKELSTLPYLEQLYARKMNDYVRTVVSGANRPNLVDTLSKAAADIKDTKVDDMWHMFKYMLELPPFPKSDDPLTYRNTKNIKNVLVRQAKSYLEDRYKVYMGNVINENLHYARRGGVPGTYPLVRSFVGLRFPGSYIGLQDGVIDQMPIWPMIYYCLRSGDYAAAFHCINKIGSCFTDIAAILEEYTNKPEPSNLMKLETAVRFQYRRQVRNSTDPFKRVVYCVLGCCDIKDEHSEVIKTADDYLWLKLNLVRNEGESEEHILLADLQKTILEDYGETHYDANNRPHLYFQMLFLTGQFEAALEFLARNKRYLAHAVHLAITVSEMCMLGGPRCVDAPLISVDIEDPVPARRLNLARLIMVYVKTFEVTNTFEAINYYFMLRNLHTQSRENLFLVCIADLAQELHQYDLFFGRMQANGLRSQGLLDQFACSYISTENLADMIAKELMRKGLYEDAVKLYDIAGNNEEVLNILCTLLTQVVNSQTQSGSQRERLQSYCEEIYRRYSKTGFKSSSAVANSFTTLRMAMEFFDHYHANEPGKALAVLRKLEIVPVAMQDVNIRVGNFKRLSTEVCKVIPDILLATMNMLFAEYKKLKINSSDTSSIEYSAYIKRLEYIQEHAKALTNFAGSIPYRMPGDVNARLVQTEILMH